MTFAMQFQRSTARMPFRRKLTLAGVFSTAIAVFLSVLGLIGVQYTQYHDAADQHYEQLGTVLASNLGAAVVFEDRNAATAILNSSDNVPNILWLEVQDLEGADFASYIGQSADPETLSLARETAVEAGGPNLSHLFASHAIQTIPIKVDGMKVGCLIVGYQHRSIGMITRDTLPVASIIFIFCLAIGVYLAGFLRKMVSRPFDRLSRAMQNVRKSGDLAARVELTNDPDFDGMINSYNGMLCELEGHNAQLATARDAAEAASVAKSAFLANMSHELRTPLNAIIGYAEVLRSDLEQAKLTRSVEDVGWINSSSKQLLEMINSLLDLSKIEAGRMTLDIHTFELAKLMAEVESTLQPLAAKQDNSLVVKIAPGIDQILSDSTKLRQCLLNLGSNACKFTRDGHIEINVRRQENELVFEISDTGIGMTEDEISKLFQPFVQSDSSTTRRFGGTGLGLALVDRFMGLLGGKVSVSSEPGFGSTFTMSLKQVELGMPVPLDQPEDHSADLALAHNAANRAQPLALIMEDEPSCVELLRRMLDRNGYETMVVGDGQAGIALARLTNPDVILLDIGLPKLDGWEVLDQLGKDASLRSIPTVVVSVDDRKSLSILKGASDHLVKPVDVDELNAVLELYAVKRTSKVLLVEDDPATARLYENGLVQNGYDVDLAGNGDEAIGKLAEKSYGLIVTDLMMPKSDGFSLIRHVSKLPLEDRPQVVAVTGRSLSSEEQDMLEENTSVVCLKGGLTPRSLVSTVSNILEQNYA